MRNGFKVFDADAHVVYPPDLWQTHLDERFRHRRGSMGKQQRRSHQRRQTLRQRSRVCFQHSRIA